MKLSNKGQHRLFFAIDFDDEFKQSLVDWIDTLDINGRRVEQENLHLTLQFLGDVSNHQVFDVIDAISVPQVRPFPIEISKTGYFPKNEILFCDIDNDNRSIQQLSSNIANSLQSLRFIKRDKRRFHPHVTIARDALPPVDFHSPKPLTTQVKYFCLMESIFIKSGVHYEIVEQWPLYTPSDKDILLGNY